MQYLLTDDEYRELVPKFRYKESLIKIDVLNEKLLEAKGYSCHQNQGFGYCDNCPIGAFGTISCTKPYKRYSK